MGPDNVIESKRIGYTESTEEMFSLPTFLSFPWSLPSLSSISLPANIQRRFLSYVLKRTLGKFVKAGGLDVDRIQTQISEGWVEIEGLEVDTEELNSYIPPGIPLVLTSGSLAKLTARIPLPNLWSAPLTITLDTLHLELDLSAPSTKGKEPETPRQLRSQQASHPSPSLDLAGSVTTAADEFLHEELDAYEEAELDRSIRQSLILSTNDPFSQEDLPGAFPSPELGSAEGPSSPLSPSAESMTVLAGLIERVLARLDFQANNVRVKINYGHPTHGGSFELRVGKVRYADESLPVEEGGPRSITRVARISSVEVFYLPKAGSSVSSSPVRPTFSPSNRSMSTSSSSSTMSSGDANADMIMSQAVADLRQSMMTSSVASGASVYEDALDELTEEPDISTKKDEGNGDAGQDEDRSATPTPAPHITTQVPDVLVLSCGHEDIVLRITTTRAQIPLVSGQSFTSSSSPPPSVSRPSIDPLASALPLCQVQLSIGFISCLLFPDQTTALLGMVQALATPSSDTKEEASMTSQPLQPRLEISLAVKGINMALVYDLSSDISQLEAPISRFWSKPSTTYLPVGHLKLVAQALEARYSFNGFVPRPAPASKLSKTQILPNRRATITTPPLPEWSGTIHQLSIFEYIPSSPSPTADPPSASALPVLIFDSNLTKQYDAGLSGASTVRSAHEAFPEYETVDWLDAKLQGRPGGERIWRVRPRGRGVMKGIPSDSESDSVMTFKSDGSAVHVELLPIHVFLDLSMIDRLLPVLRHISPAIRRSHTDSHASSPVATKHPNPLPMSSQYVIDDLQAKKTPTQPPAPPSTVSCPMIRLDVRCPAPPKRRERSSDSIYRLMGIVTLDVHQLRISLASPASQDAIQPSRPVRFNLPTDSVNTTPASIRLNCQKAILFFCRASEKKTSAFLIVGPIAPDPSDANEELVLPNMEFRSNLPVQAGSRSEIIPCQHVLCRVPCIQANIHKSTVEGLQFFADDITHWLDGAFGDGSRPRPRDELKLIGSRFFGSKGSSTSSSTIEDEGDDEVRTGSILHFLISDFDATLHVPRRRDGVAQADRVLCLRASDVDTKVESNVSNNQETSITLTIMDLGFTDHSARDPVDILTRTTPRSLARHSPVIRLVFSSMTEPVSENKETGIDIAVSSSTFFIQQDLLWIKDLASFAKTPEGVFEDVIPSEITRVHFQIDDSSLHLKAPSMKGALVLVFGYGDIKTEIVSDADESTLDLSFARCGILFIDDIAAATPKQPDSVSGLDVWRDTGYASMAEVTGIEVQVWRDQTGTQEILVDILRSQLRLTACADSMATFGDLAGDLGKLAPPKEEDMIPIKWPTSLDKSIDVFASVDEEAFNRMPDITSGADLIEDDLPTNPDYLERSTKRASGLQNDQQQEILSSWQPGGHGDDVDQSLSAELNGETIRILYDQPLETEENYWDKLPVVTDDYSDETRVGKLRVRVHESQVSIYLHDGYDWQGTRKTIEAEIKAVRRRLERIRQLLASGQKADDSIENTRSVLFNSVYIGLDERNEDLDSAALLAAIDEELDGLAAADTASQSSWQTDFPAGPRRHGERKTTGRTPRLRGKRLTRSKKPLIEIGFHVINIDFDVFGPNDPTASRLHATVKSMEILDHIKTSTWKKFLTEMKSDSRGNVRETDADMVRIEMMTVRPGVTSTVTNSGNNPAIDDDDVLDMDESPSPPTAPFLGEEVRLRAKMLPLRLHVDQDALDFFKRFFSFSAVTQADQSVTNETRGGDTSTPQPFFQHVEIFPVEIKLDYKPKRVDFKALREGRTIELMNFFHFDGAEMTLRHITISGISGWARLSTTLQDLWTPDVKANQLADVISGVSPIRSMVNVGSGVADLILLPIEQYRKDGRVARGVQRGTSSFVRSTAMEMMKLGARLATGTQVVLEKAEGVLGDKAREGVLGEVPTLEIDQEVRGIESEDEGGIEVVSRYANQPGGAKEGVQAAYQSLSKNVNAAAQTILAVPMEVYERSGDDGPIRAVVRAVPIAILKPMIGASEAVSKTLLGVRNSLDPEGRKELGDKYK